MAQSADDLHTREYNLPDGRAVLTRRVNAPPDAVWSVLADGWMYATWVVGASRVRKVEPDWPTPGSRLHHSFGIWPALINDHTEVLAADPGRELVLKARGWPAGEASVRIRITPGGTPDSSTVSIVEDATSGPGKLIPRAARQLLIAPRNTEAIRRLAFIAEGRRKHHTPGEPTATTGPQLVT
jgi:uncharacterized protein YndB with AHSA1/START domain